MVEVEHNKSGRKRSFERIIFHADMDSFYASCELSKRPELKEKPFIVGADPKQGHGRGVVIACNYAARKFGIHSATPISRAWELCPTATFVRPNWSLYGEVSKRVFSLIRQFADVVEQVSIDEAYLDVKKRIELLLEEYESEDQAIRELSSSIKKAVFDSEKITCSIGVSNSKIVSKIATDMNKPDGLTIIFPEKTSEFLAPLPVGKIPGVGKVTEHVLESEFKVKTIEDLRKVPLEDLHARFGRSGSWLSEVSHGIDPSEVVEHLEPVSISGETTFEEDESDYSRVRDVLFEVARDVHRRTASERYLFRNVGIKIRFTGFETHTRSKSLKAPTDSVQVLNEESEKLLSEFYSSGRKVRLIGVRVSGLERNEQNQMTLLQWEG